MADPAICLVVSNVLNDLETFNLDS